MAKVADAKAEGRDIVQMLTGEPGKRVDSTIGIDTFKVASLKNPLKQFWLQQDIDKLQVPSNEGTRLQPGRMVSTVNKVTLFEKSIQGTPHLWMKMVGPQ